MTQKPGKFSPTCKIQLVNVFRLQDMLLGEKTGSLLKFSGELEDVSREDFHELFSGHGKIKWVDFTRGAKEVNTLHCKYNYSVQRCDVGVIGVFFAFHKGALLFDGNAKEAFDKAKEANGGELKVKDNSVTWQLLEGEEEKEALKRIIEAQQETQRNKGRGKMAISKTLDLYFTDIDHKHHSNYLLTSAVWNESIPFLFSHILPKSQNGEIICLNSFF